MEEENAMKRLKFIIYCFIAFGVALPAFSAEFAFHGDMNNRFLLYTNRADWLDAGTDHSGVINKGEVKDNYGELKYRFWIPLLVRGRIQ
jgi:hypothetical protein